MLGAYFVCVCDPWKGGRHSWGGSLLTPEPYLAVCFVGLRLRRTALD
jgi:hypothetical protein